MVANASVAAANAAAIGQVLSAKYNMIGNIGSALLGGGSNLASAFLSYGQQKKLASHNAQLNYEYAEKSARNSPIWNRAGLESAGYNPMLAVQNSTSGANSSWTSAQSANAPDIAGGISSGIANAQSFQRLKNETTVADQTSKKLEAEGENLNADTANKLEENKYIGDKRKKEIANIQADTLEKEARIDNMKKQIELGFAGVNVQQEANAISAIGKEEYADRAKRYKEWGEKYGWLRNIDETITRYFNGFGANVGASKKIK